MPITHKTMDLIENETLKWEDASLWQVWDATVLAQIGKETNRPAALIKAYNQILREYVNSSRNGFSELAQAKKALKRLTGPYLAYKYREQFIDGEEYPSATNLYEKVGLTKE
jgi:hypothetical protein